MVIRLIIFICTVLSLTQCKRESSLFKQIPSVYSGITFVNTVEEKDTLNILNVQYMYHGAAVAVGDFNNDNLTDIFFSGNMVPNRLYINRGKLQFNDVTEQSGIANTGKWNAGTAVADVNNDGLLDIYVCATIHSDPARRANSLFINKGVNEHGKPRFQDMAQQYGVDDKGYSQNAAFFDYDKDGDLDLYVLTNLESDKIPSNYRPRITDGSALNNDRLYRNNSNGTFTDVTVEAGILMEGYGLGIAIADINKDSWPDIYISNDYVSNDILYINNKNGTFSNQIKDRIKHQSLFSMGVDLADINNDQATDIITLDMLPENNLRRKTVSGAGATYFNYINNVEYGYEFQYMRNMLQVNNGDGTFSEVGQMAGVHQTDWSWSPLFIDVDNDGYRDLLITNGFPKDVTDRDYVMFKREAGIFRDQRALIDSIPVLKVPNYAYKNNGDLTFTDKTSEWGFDIPSFSHGAAYADLDNDGDLDYIVNNINDEAFLFENKLYDVDKMSDNNYIRIKLLPGREMPITLGTKITIRYNQNKYQYHDHSIYRGYLSTVEDIIHFGIGIASEVELIQIEWPNNKKQTIRNIKANNLLQIKYNPDHDQPGLNQNQNTTFLKETSRLLNINFKHEEWDKVDFYKQRTLPHKLSQSGPGIAVGDINGDDLEDFIIGGSAMFDATIFVQEKSGSFKQRPFIKTKEKKSEDQGLLLFDADNDYDLDLYVVSGSYEHDVGHDRNQDRLYRNDGNGNFSHDLNALPPTLASGSCVRAADYDLDGDLDLFIGGRVVSGSYPLPAQSYLLENINGTFVNATSKVCLELESFGMITDALWSDYNNDGLVDLIVVGEFAPIVIFRNDGKYFKRALHTGIETLWGWWNSITGSDFDNDGDTDYIVGNLGHNNLYHITADQPLRVYAKDFDENGSIDAVLSCYFKSEQDDMREYPVHSWDELYAQSPRFRNQFNNYKQYGGTEMKDLLKPYDTAEVLKLKLNYPSTSYFENTGDGTFSVKALSQETQVAPINGMAVLDVNNDSNSDVLMVGNDYGNEVFSGRYDASNGALLLGDGRGNFKFEPLITSGFAVKGDAKALAKIKTKQSHLFIATQNRDTLKVFAKVDETKRNSFDPSPNDFVAELHFTNGRKQRIELYYGSSYLSQSSRSIEISDNVTHLSITNYKGEQRTIQYRQLAKIKSN